LLLLQRLMRLTEAEAGGQGPNAVSSWGFRPDQAALERPADARAGHDRLAQIAAEPVPAALLPAADLLMTTLKSATLLRRTRRVNLHACACDCHHYFPLF
jgi:hypothetical protein